MCKLYFNKCKISVQWIVFFCILYLLPSSSTAQFSSYNQHVRELNYYLIYLEHLLSYHEQTTLLMKDISIIYQKNDTVSFNKKNWTSYQTADVDLYRKRMNTVSDAVQNKYDAASFINYNRKVKHQLPDSVNRLFTNWIKRADSISVSQTKIANDLLTLIVQYNLMPGYETKDVYRIHAYINSYHSRIQELQQLRDSMTSAALSYYEKIRSEKKYPFSIYAEAVEYILQATVFINHYFAAHSEGNDEGGVIALRKANENIQAYLTNEYIYRKNNNALPGHHVFPLNEEVHIAISNSLKEMSFQINRYISNYEEQVDSVYFSKQNVNLINLLNAVSFSHDENVDVRKRNDIPERYHETLKAMLRYDFLLYRYDTYSNSKSNKNTAPMPLSWSRYVFTFNYEMPQRDSIASTPEVTPEEKPAEKPIEKKEVSSIQILNVYTDSVSLFFYDNGEVDNDTITISINGVVVAANVRLDVEPYVLKIAFNPGEKSKDVTISANNLGNIPPNTAFLKITAGDIVHRLYVFTTKKADAVVRIVNEKKE